MKEEYLKYKREVAPESISAFLRDLANAFESSKRSAKTDGELNELIKNYQKISLFIKPKRDLVYIKLKVKKPESDALADNTTQNDGPSKNQTLPQTETEIYKSLKREMARDFRSIKTDLAANRLPKDDVVRRFCDDSTRMVTYPGKGDPHYDSYSRVVVQLKAAFDNRDHAHFKSIIETLTQLRKTCHQKYK